MFERIAKFRREPNDELLDIEHSPGRCGGSAAKPGGSRDGATFTVLLQRHQTFLRIYRASGESSGLAAQPATRLFRIATNLALKEVSDNGNPAPSADAFENARRCYRLHAGQATGRGPLAALGY